MRSVIIIQTRMGSTRLPGKVMYPLNGKVELEQVIQRVKMAEQIDDIVIATTTNEVDEIIVHWAKELGVNYFRGSELDVLSRYYMAAKKFNAQIVIRITSDCPLIDPELIDSIILKYKRENPKLATNSGPFEEKRTFPRGLDVEVFGIDVLEEAYLNALEPYEREHVTPYIYSLYRSEITHYLNEENLSYYRWTLDTIEDYKFITRIFEDLIKTKPTSNWRDIHNYLLNNKALLKINAHIEQKKVIYKEE